MKTRLELTKEQVDILVAQQGKRLRTRFEKDLASIKKNMVQLRLILKIFPQLKELTRLKSLMTCLMIISMFKN